MKPQAESSVGPTLAAYAHLHGLQSGYLPPVTADDSPAAPPWPPYPAPTAVPQPAFQPHPPNQHIAQPYVAQSAPHAYPPQVSGYAEQPSAAQQHPHGSPYSGQPHMAQPYPGQPIHGQYPAYGHPAPQAYPPQPYAPPPGYGHVHPHGAAQPYGQPSPHYADSAQSLHAQQYAYPPHAGYAMQPGYPAHAALPTHAPYSAATQPMERFSVQPPFTPGYSVQPPRALLRSADDLGVKKAWQVSDDAPRYAPPGSSEADLDPFGLAALPEQATYHGPKELPSEAVYALLLGLCSLLLFPLAFLGFVRARRAGSMIDAAPSRFRGRLVVLLGLALNLACPILSVAAGAYLVGLL